MGAHMVATYTTTDGRTLVNEWGNGWGDWYFKTPNTEGKGPRSGPA